MIPILYEAALYFPRVQGHKRSKIRRIFMKKRYDEPPSLLETLLWWWVVRPDLGAAIALEAPPELKEIISQYILKN